MELSLKVLTSYVGMTKPTMIKVGNSYKCTLCKKAGDYASLVPHIQTHSRNVLTYKGIQIYKCGLECSDVPHYHCCFCNKNVGNKNLFVRHLKRCEEYCAHNVVPKQTCSGEHNTAQTTVNDQVSSSQQSAKASSMGTSTTHIVLQTISGPSLLQTVTTPVRLQGTAAPLWLQTTRLPLQNSTATPLLLQTTTTTTTSSAKQTSTARSSLQDTSTTTFTLQKTPTSTSSQDEVPTTTSSPPQTPTTTVSELQTPTTAPLELETLTNTSSLLQTPITTSSLQQTNTTTPPLPQNTASPLSPLQSTTAPSWQQSTVTTSSSELTPTATPSELETSLADSTPSESNLLQTTLPASPSFSTVTRTSMAPHPEAISPSSPSQSSSPPGSKEQRPRIKCPHCPMVLFKRNLKVHIARHHKDIPADPKVRFHLRSVCVDAKNGILAVQRHAHGFLAPVHAQRKVYGGQVVRCDLKECQQYQQMAQRHGLTVSHCQHTRSLEYCTETAADESLEPEVLDEMVTLKFFSEAKRAMCLRRQKMAQAAKVPFAVLVDLGGSPRQMFVSVHEPKTNNFSCLGRVMVSYNIDRNAWHCPCTKPHMSCLHKNIAKWHIFQTNRDLFKTSASSSRDTSGSWNMEYTNGNSAYSANSDIKRSVEYIYDHKRIPADLPEDVTNTVFEFPSHLFPVETTCGVCPHSPGLEDAENVTDQGRIVTMIGVADNVSTYIRRCPDCQMLYRYQEWQDGLHNFDNHLILSIELCLYLRHSLQNHIPVTRAVRTLESLRRIQFPPTEALLNAYSHFEAMTSSDDMYSCASYGSQSSPAIIMDLHRKAFLTLHWSS
ncbi:uncharacterized protein LOC116218625 isoform X2 [Clupea harengus]|uniref:Uncharacterized protein LOC116218625 isoform X2 n=1 Tax=Clupea harengus TaxID=7950 RepID=A0A6P8EXY0_CLUHA|nr:uncharacterized protein LOC116218625 isoform X2 [Clupea harengus]